MQPMLTIAVRAARAAGNTIIRKFERIDALSLEPKQCHDFVSGIHNQAKEKIVEILHQFYPSHKILSEESDLSCNSKYLWIIHPLDGITNYLHGFPQFAVSIVLQKNGKLEQAVIYDPVSQELFTASRGCGAWLDNKRLRVSKRRDLENSLLGTGPSYGEQNTDCYTAHFMRGTNGGIRCTGATALNLAYVAAGRLDGFWEADLKPWSTAAGSLIVREAGGLIGDFSGAENWLENGQVVAANPKIFSAMLQMTKLIQ